MTRIFQDTEGEIIELLNSSIEQIICIDGVEAKIIKIYELQRYHYN